MKCPPSDIGFKTFHFRSTKHRVQWHIKEIVKFCLTLQIKWIVCISSSRVFKNVFQFKENFLLPCKDLTNSRITYVNSASVFPRNTTHFEMLTPMTYLFKNASTPVKSAQVSISRDEFVS